MIINSASLAIAIVAGILCLVFFVMAVFATLQKRRERSQPDLITRLEMESSRRELARMQSPGSA